MYVPLQDKSTARCCKAAIILRCIVDGCRNRIVGSDEKTVFEQWRIPVAVQPLNRRNLSSCC